MTSRSSRANSLHQPPPPLEATALAAAMQDAVTTMAATSGGAAPPPATARPSEVVGRSSSAKRRALSPQTDEEDDEEGEDDDLLFDDTLSVFSDMSINMSGIGGGSSMMSGRGGGGGGGSLGVLGGYFGPQIYAQLQQFNNSPLLGGILVGGGGGTSSVFRTSQNSNNRTNNGYTSAASGAAPNSVSNRGGTGVRSVSFAANGDGQGDQPSNVGPQYYSKEDAAGDDPLNGLALQRGSAANRAAAASRGGGGGGPSPIPSPSPTFERHPHHTASCKQGGGVVGGRLSLSDRLDSLFSSRQEALLRQSVASGYGGGNSILVIGGGNDTPTPTRSSVTARRARAASAAPQEEEDHGGTSFARNSKVSRVRASSSPPLNSNATTTTSSRNSNGRRLWAVARRKVTAALRMVAVLHDLRLSPYYTDGLALCLYVERHAPVARGGAAAGLCRLLAEFTSGDRGQAMVLGTRGHMRALLCAIGYGALRCGASDEKRGKGGGGDHHSIDDEEGVVRRRLEAFYDGVSTCRLADRRALDVFIGDTPSDAALGGEDTRGVVEVRGPQLLGADWLASPKAPLGGSNINSSPAECCALLVQALAHTLEASSSARAYFGHCWWLFSGGATAEAAIGGGNAHANDSAACASAPSSSSAVPSSQALVPMRGDAFVCELLLRHGAQPTAARALLLAGMASEPDIVFSEGLSPETCPTAAAAAASGPSGAAAGPSQYCGGLSVGAWVSLRRAMGDALSMLDTIRCSLDSKASASGSDSAADDAHAQQAQYWATISRAFRTARIAYEVATNACALLLESSAFVEEEEEGGEATIVDAASPVLVPNTDGDVDGGHMLPLYRSAKPSPGSPLGDDAESYYQRNARRGAKRAALSSQLPLPLLVVEQLEQIRSAAGKVIGMALPMLVRSALEGYVPAAAAAAGNGINTAAGLTNASFAASAEGLGYAGGGGGFHSVSAPASPSSSRRASRDYAHPSSQQQQQQHYAAPLSSSPPQATVGTGGVATLPAGPAAYHGHAADVATSLRELTELSTMYFMSTGGGMGEPEGLAALSPLASVLRRCSAVCHGSSSSAAHCQQWVAGVILDGGEGGHSLEAVVGRPPPLSYSSRRLLADCGLISACIMREVAMAQSAAHTHHRDDDEEGTGGEGTGDSQAAAMVIKAAGLLATMYGGTSRSRSSAGDVHWLAQAHARCPSAVDRGMWEVAAAGALAVGCGMLAVGEVGREETHAVPPTSSLLLSVRTAIVPLFALCPIGAPSGGLLLQPLTALATRILVADRSSSTSASTASLPAITLTDVLSYEASWAAKCLAALLVSTSVVSASSPSASSVVGGGGGLSSSSSPSPLLDVLAMAVWSPFRAVLSLVEVLWQCCASDTGNGGGGNGGESAVAHLMGVRPAAMGGGGGGGPRSNRDSVMRRPTRGRSGAASRSRGPSAGAAGSGSLPPTTFVPSPTALAAGAGASVFDNTAIFGDTARSVDVGAGGGIVFDDGLSTVAPSSYRGGDDDDGDTVASRLSVGRSGGGALARSASGIAELNFSSGASLSHFIASISRVVAQTASDQLLALLLSAAEVLARLLFTAAGGQQPSDVGVDGAIASPSASLSAVRLGGVVASCLGLHSQFLQSAFTMDGSGGRGPLPHQFAAMPFTVKKVLKAAVEGVASVDGHLLHSRYEGLMGILDLMLAAAFPSPSSSPSGGWAIAAATNAGRCYSHVAVLAHGLGMTASSSLRRVATFLLDGAARCRARVDVAPSLVLLCRGLSMSSSSSPAAVEGSSQSAPVLSSSPPLISRELFVVDLATKYLASSLRLGDVAGDAEGCAAASMSGGGGDGPMGPLGAAASIIVSTGALSLHSVSPSSSSSSSSVQRHYCALLAALCDWVPVVGARLLTAHVGGVGGTAAAATAAIAQQVQGMLGRPEAWQGALLPVGHVGRGNVSQCSADLYRVACCIALVTMGRKGDAPRHYADADGDGGGGLSQSLAAYLVDYGGPCTVAMFEALLSMAGEEEEDEVVGGGDVVDEEDRIAGALVAHLRGGDGMQQQQPILPLAQFWSRVAIPNVVASRRAKAPPPVIPPTLLLQSPPFEGEAFAAPLKHVFALSEEESVGRAAIVDEAYAAASSMLVACVGEAVRRSSPPPPPCAAREVPAVLGEGVGVGGVLGTPPSVLLQPTCAEDVSATMAVLRGGDVYVAVDNDGRECAAVHRDDCRPPSAVTVAIEVVSPHVHPSYRALEAALLIAEEVASRAVLSAECFGLLLDAGRAQWQHSSALVATVGKGAAPSPRHEEEEVGAEGAPQRRKARGPPRRAAAAAVDGDGDCDEDDGSGDDSAMAFLLPGQSVSTVNNCETQTDESYVMASSSVAARAAGIADGDVSGEASQQQQQPQSCELLVAAHVGALRALGCAHEEALAHAASSLLLDRLRGACAAAMISDAVEHATTRSGARAVVAANGTDGGGQEEGEEEVAQLKAKVEALTAALDASQSINAHHSAGALEDLRASMGARVEAMGASMAAHEAAQLEAMAALERAHRRRLDESEALLSSAHAAKEAVAAADYEVTARSLRDEVAKHLHVIAVMATEREAMERGRAEDGLRAAEALVSAVMGCSSAAASALVDAHGRAGKLVLDCNKAFMGTLRDVLTGLAAQEVQQEQQHSPSRLKHSNTKSGNGRRRRDGDKGDGDDHGDATLAVMSTTPKDVASLLRKLERQRLRHEEEVHQLREALRRSNVAMISTSSRSHHASSSTAAGGVGGGGAVGSPDSIKDRYAKGGRDRGTYEMAMRAVGSDGDTHDDDDDAHHGTDGAEVARAQRQVIRQLRRDLRQVSAKLAHAAKANEAQSLLWSHDQLQQGAKAKAYERAVAEAQSRAEALSQALVEAVGSREDLHRALVKAREELAAAKRDLPLLAAQRLVVDSYKMNRLFRDPLLQQQRERDDGPSISPIPQRRPQSALARRLSLPRSDSPQKGASPSPNPHHSDHHQHQFHSQGRPSSAALVRSTNTRRHLDAGASPQTADRAGGGGGVSSASGSRARLERALMDHRGDGGGGDVSGGGARVLTPTPPVTPSRAEHAPPPSSPTMDMGKGLAVERPLLLGSSTLIEAEDEDGEPCQGRGVAKGATASLAALLAIAGPSRSPLVGPLSPAGSRRKDGSASQPPPPPLLSSTSSSLGGAGANVRNRPNNTNATSAPSYMQSTMSSSNHNNSSNQQNAPRR